MIRTAGPRCGRTALAGIVLFCLLAGAAVGAPPLPATGPLREPTLTPSEVKSIVSALEQMVTYLVLVLSFSCALNFYMAKQVRDHLETINKLIGGMAMLHQAQAALREVAMYWLERRADRLELHELTPLITREPPKPPPSRFAVPEAEAHAEDSH